jgi:hypothetical protein
MPDFDDLQKFLRSVADVVNAFKSEAVQLRVIDTLLGQIDTVKANSNVQARGVRRKRKVKHEIQEFDPTVEHAQPLAKASRTPKKARNTSSPGGYAMVTQLLAEGFFRKPQTIGAITSHSGSTKGHHYKANEISPVLLRMLRDGRLKRTKNKDGQYEYTQG